MIAQFIPAAVHQTVSISFETTLHRMVAVRLPLLGFWHFPDGDTQPLVMWNSRLRTVNDVLLLQTHYAEHYLSGQPVEKGLPATVKAVIDHELVAE